ncbi:class I SAM-dependent methyltransferase [Streptomyces hirsutus]
MPAFRATRGDTPLETLVRLFLLQQPVPHARVAAVLPVDACLEDGWLTRACAGATSSRPWTYGRTAGPRRGQWFIVSDLGCAVGGASGIGSAHEGVVLGAGGASTTLAGITVRTPVASVLDLGTGSGIQALHATRHATRVTATDVNPRALRITALTLALSGVPAADLREGSLFAPVRADEKIDLIVSNPPFVISPGANPPPTATAEWAGTICAARSFRRWGNGSATAGSRSSSPTGSTSRGEDWQDRLRSWVPRGCDAWIVQREVQDVTQYTEPAACWRPPR